MFLCLLWDSTSDYCVNSRWFGWIFYSYFTSKRKRTKAHRDAEDILREAKSQEKEIILEAKDLALNIREKTKKEEFEEEN